MAYTTKTLKDGAGSNFDAAVWTPGRGAAAESAPVVLSTEDLAALNSLIAKLPAALVSGRLSVAPAMASGGVIAVSTPVAGGSGYQAAGSQACSYIMISNPSSTTLRVQLGGSGEYLTLAAGQAIPLHGLSNTSAVGVKRADELATQARLEIHWAA